MVPRPPSPAALYIHIPFCHARCGYCDFVTFTGKEDGIPAYVDAVCEEIALHAARPWLGLEPFDTIFFGGGTPSVLEPEHIQTILSTVRERFEVSPEPEITLEANPESVSAEKAAGWKRAGVNRLSLGLQAFDDTLLKAMGRLHTIDGFLKAYDFLRQAGFQNVSFDLIYGFPDQSLDSWQNTVDSALRLKPEHLSLYSLLVEAHTPFALAGVTVDNDLQGAMYEWARKFLEEKGLSQYEISNFARPGYGCRHNMVYWRQQNYLGVGTGAVGCVGDLRWTNQKSLETYQKDLSAGRLPWHSSEHIDSKSRRFERLMLGLRLREGLDWTDERDESWLQVRSELSKKGWLEQVESGRWRVAESLVGMTNQVLLPFL